jgi:hypothetical protein
MPEEARQADRTPLAKKRARKRPKNSSTAEKRFLLLHLLSCPKTMMCKSQSNGKTKLPTAPKK